MLTIYRNKALVSFYITIYFIFKKKIDLKIRLIDIVY